MSKPKKMRKLIKAAKMCKPYAMFGLGLCYETGKYLPQNTALALEWISAAASMGYAPAAEWLADFYFDDDAQVQANA